MGCCMGAVFLQEDKHLGIWRGPNVCPSLHLWPATDVFNPKVVQLPMKIIHQEIMFACPSP